MLYAISVFKAVYEDGGFSKAGRKLGLTQSAVSQQIKGLEEELKVPLFYPEDRTAPTNAGDYLYNEGARLLALYNDIKNSIINVEDVVKGKIVYGMIDVAAIGLLPSVIDRFRKKYPEVKMEAFVKPSGELINMVRNYQLDFAVAVGDRMMEGLSFRTIYNDSIVAVVAEGSPLAKKSELSISDIKGEPLILYPKTSYSRKLIESEFEKFGVVPTVTMEMHYPAAILSLVAQGMGVGLISEMSYDSERHPRLKKIPVNELKDKRPIGLVTLEDRHPSPQANALIGMILSS